ncbi:hypothetical protein QQ045_032152 [Rhodiola kirilowii]
MASQLRVGSSIKRPRIDSESADNQTNDGGGAAAGGGADGGGIEIVAPDDFTDDLIDIVFSYLPVLYAARMSVVSPRLKDSWKHSKNMIFDESIVGGKEQPEVVHIVNAAMNQHQGSKINKFSLYIKPTCFLIDDWIKIALNKDVEEIELDYSPYRVKWGFDLRVFGTSSARSLKLVNVFLQGNFGLHSMVNLRDLRLRRCDLKFFGDVIHFCTSLELLEIVNCRNVGRLVINGPWRLNLRTLKIGACQDLKEVQVSVHNLNTFYYHGNIRKITVHNGLERVFVSYKRNKSIMAENLVTNSMVCSAESLKVLTVNSVFLEVMYPEFNKGILVANESLFPNLTEFHIYMESYTHKTIGYLRYLLKRCPRLETLHVDLARCKGHGGDKGLIERKIALFTETLHFNHLKVIKIKGYKPTGQERDFVQYLAARSPALETLALVYSPSSVHLSFPLPFPDDHLSYFAISPALKISHYDHDKDNSCIAPSQTKSWYSS